MLRKVHMEHVGHCAKGHHYKLLYTIEENQYPTFQNVMPGVILHYTNVLSTYMFPNGSKLGTQRAHT